jgi:protease-4
MTEKKKTGIGCLWAVLIVQSLMMAVMFLVIVGFVINDFFKGSVPQVGRHSLGEDEWPDMEEVWSCGSGNTKVVRINLDGMIMLGGEESVWGGGVSSADMALRAIRRATHDDEVQAIIMTIDSGGGGITASDVLYQALLDFKAAGEGRKVISIFGDLGASGAYYVALASDYIIAHPTTVTGSLGVLMQSINARELAQKLGVRDVTIKSGNNKDLLNPLGEMTEEQRLMLQGIVDSLHERFIDLIAEGRQLSATQVRALADGRIFVAEEALELGLIDEIGYWEDAMVATAELLSVDEVKVFRFEEKFKFSMLFEAYQRMNPLSRLLYNPVQQRFLYQ